MEHSACEGQPATDRRSAREGNCVSPVIAGAGGLAAALVVAFSLASCGEPQRREEQRPSPGQTIARVNGQEITAHELEAELKDLGPVKAGEQTDTTREMLRRIIQRTLLAQKAVEKNLHRLPDVMTDLRRTEADVLARAYLFDSLADQMPISKYDIEDFIEQNPHYFARRKHYIFDQLVIAKDQLTDEARQTIATQAGLEQIETALAEMDIGFKRRLNANLASQFPKPAAARIDALGPGEIFFTETRDQMVISKLIESRLQPVPEDEAREIARQLLTARRDAAAGQKVVETVMAGANVELLGEYSDLQLFVPEPLTDDGAAEAETADAPAPRLQQTGASRDQTMVRE